MRAAGYPGEGSQCQFRLARFDWLTGANEPARARDGALDWTGTRMKIERLPWLQHYHNTSSGNFGRA